MTSNRTFYKILTHDFCPPLQGGKPIWDGVTLPFQLPTVALDTHTVIESSYGWHFVEDLAEGFKIAGLWPTGRPSVVLAVTPSADALACGTKRRASSLRLDRLATEAEIRAAVVRLSEGFGQHAERMAEEQQAWRTALARPAHDVATVETGLVAALRERGLRGWTTQSFESARAAWDALAALGRQGLLGRQGRQARLGCLRRPDGLLCSPSEMDER